jgi:hypothetical protein
LPFFLLCHCNNHSGADTVYFKLFWKNPVTLYTFKRLWGWPPLSPGGGGRPRRTSPWPLFVHLSRLKREFLVDLQRAIAFFMTAKAQAETKVSEIPKGLRIIFQGFPMKIMIIRYNERGVVNYHCDERCRPKTGLPMRRFKWLKNSKNCLTPPCLGEALMRGILVISMIFLQ